MSQPMNGIAKSNGSLSTTAIDNPKLPEVRSEVGQGIDLLTTSSYTYETLMQTAQFLLDRTTVRPSIGIICGSGMDPKLFSGPLAESLTHKKCFPYEDIPGFPVSTVEGHIGQLVFGYLGDIPVVCMQGRFHYYEGYPLWKCCMPVRVMKLLGVHYLVATNAAGGLNPNFKVGDIMLVQDHINLMGFAGNNPLQGPNDERFGPRFPPMNKAYSKELIQVAKEIAKELDIDSIMREGVYTCLGGPNFETVSELKMLKMLGVDAVGMSTVHEVITARHCDMTVFAFSLITNECVMDYYSSGEANHEEVMDVGKLQQKTLCKFIYKIVQHIGNNLLSEK
ncbi:purine nucleoside phosphorylase isoform X1 [Arctopsyche grandis]|uniref:purine nucleoside phosphorylase isoform X1 n=1 Tax=Arctopsyche grandis TaxID=121162 RepID=UPI00406D710F